MLHLSARIVSSAAAFVYPAYASYKTLSQRPAHEADLERWLMYWSVLGSIVGVELLAEWLLAWIPFYYPLKSLFLLYLVLPQTQGAAYIYTTHLRPFFHAHETQIDDALAQLRARAYRFVQARLRALWAALASQAPQQQAPAQDAGALGSLWRTYAARIAASGTALMAAAAAPPPAPRAREPQPGPGPELDLVERRRRLQAELAALESAVPRVRERTDSGAGSAGRFEEVEVPSDVEGYEVDGAGGGEGQARQRSWFAWRGAGYERVKSE
ncbi:hypothetical protein C0993_005072 [Termitomyces sp. T159_Od127]|nr:hypothetical protein C0993_005072 [Termitomyces sp. T159_Od127]